MGAENIMVASSVLLLCIQCYRAIPSAYRALPVPTVQFPCLLGVPRVPVGKEANGGQSELKYFDRWLSAISRGPQVSK